MRYDDADIEKLANSKDHFTFSFTLNDKFGDNGLICVVILRKENASTLFIDSWFMSCRVLKRGMENFVLNSIVEFAKDKCYSSIIGEYVPTAKNEMVKEHYANLGFTERTERWHLDVPSYETKKNFIRTK